MAVLSGKNGTISIDGAEETPVTDWSLDISANLDDYVANDTSGWTKRKAGARDCSGSFNMKDLPSFDEGDEVAFVGYTNQDIYTVNVVIERIGVTVDFRGAIVTWAVTFQGNGAVAKTTGSAI